MGDVEMERNQKKGREKLTQIEDIERKIEQSKRKKINETDRHKKKWMLGEEKDEIKEDNRR